jgi:hypothetical protein
VKPFGDPLGSEIRAVTISPAEGSRFVRGGVTSYCSEPVVWVSVGGGENAVAPRLDADMMPLWYPPEPRYYMRPDS